MSRNILVKMVPIIVDENDDSVTLTLPGSGQKKMMSRSDFKEKYGDTVDLETMKRILNIPYDSTKKHCERLEREYNSIAMYGEEERKRILREYEVIDFIKDKLARIKAQYDFLEMTERRANNEDTD